MLNGRDDDGFGDLTGLEDLDGAADEWSESAPAPGALLPPFRPSPLLERTRFDGMLADASTVTVDVDHSSGQASLYRNGRHVQTSDMPARFRAGREDIHVAASKYGMQRIHLVRSDGSERRLDPAPGTPEALRARLSSRHPALGRGLAIAAVIVLVVNLVFLAPQLLELVTHLPLWSDRFAPFVSPIQLPVWANTALSVTAALAGIERALTFRHHRLLDTETEGIEV